MMEQDRVIAQLVGDNLDHLQDNMRQTAHINSSQERMAQMEHRLGQVRSVVMGFLEGRLEGLIEEEREGEMTGLSSSSEVGTLGVSGDVLGDQDGDEVNADDGAFPRESMRRDSPMPREEGLITQMEREAMEAGLGGWLSLDTIFARIFCPFSTQLHFTFLTPPFSLMLILVVFTPLCPLCYHAHKQTTRTQFDWYYRTPNNSSTGLLTS